MGRSGMTMPKPIRSMKTLRKMTSKDGRFMNSRLPPRGATRVEILRAGGCASSRPQDAFHHGSRPNKCAGMDKIGRRMINRCNEPTAQGYRWRHFPRVGFVLRNPRLQAEGAGL